MTDYGKTVKTYSTTQIHKHTLSHVFALASHNMRSHVEKVLNASLTSGNLLWGMQQRQL